MKVRTLPYRDKEELSLSVEVRRVQACASQRDTKVTSDRRQTVELSGDRSMPTESSCNKKADPRAQQQPFAAKELRLEASQLHRDYPSPSLTTCFRFLSSFSLFILSVLYFKSSPSRLHPVATPSKHYESLQSAQTRDCSYLA